MKTLDATVECKNLSLEAREYAFQHWIAFFRCSSPVFTSENLRCPLLGCNLDLDSLPAYLQHITSCPQLKNPHYWCPLHQQAETFAIDKTRPKRSLRTCLVSKVSKAASCILMVTAFPVLAPQRYKRRRRQGTQTSRSELDNLEISRSNMPLQTSSLLSGDFPDSKRSVGYRMEAPASELEDSPIYPVPNRLTELPSPGIFRPELPSPDPFVRPVSQVPGLNTIRHELSTPEPHWNLAELPSPLTDPASRRLPDLSNSKRSVSDIPGFFMNRRSEPPRLSIVTTQSSCAEYHHPTQATASSRNSKTYRNINHDTPSRAYVGAHVPMVSGASSYSIGSSSVQSSLFDRSITDRKFPLEEWNDLGTPSSAGSDLDPLPFDPSAFRSPTSPKEKICLVRKTSKPFATALEQPPAATNISPSSRRPGLPMEEGIEAVCSPLDICQAAPSTSSTSCEKRIGLDTTGTSNLSLTQQLVQDVEDGIISMHRQCISTHNPGTDRTMRMFGPNGYSAFKRGLQVFRGLHKGIIPCSADAICALLQVSLQFLSYVQRRGNDSWWSLSQTDLHEWSLAIEDKDERDSFTEAINILWVNWQFMQRRRPCANPHRTLQTPSHTPSSAADKAQQSSTLAGVQLALVSPLSDQLSFDQAFRDNAVVQSCSRFLDGKQIAICL